VKQSPKLGQNGELGEMENLKPKMADGQQRGKLPICAVVRNT
jgi:hypothetical protein